MERDLGKAIFCIAFLVWALARRIGARRCRRPGRGEAHGDALDRLLIVGASVGMIAAPCIYLTTPWLDFADYAAPVWAGVLGAVAAAASICLLWRTHADLGRSFSPYLELQREHSVVTRGVYSRIRHPMYSAHWLWAVAQALLLPNWVAGPALLLTFLPLYLRRVPREERMLLDRFGEEYRSYMERTGRLLPRLRR